MRNRSIKVQLFRELSHETNNVFPLVVLLVPPVPAGNPRCRNRKRFELLNTLLTDSLLHDDHLSDVVPPTNKEDRSGV